MRYIQLNLNKLNITHVMYRSFIQQWHEQEIKVILFINFLKIKSEAEFLISSEICFQSRLALYAILSRPKFFCPRILRFKCVESVRIQFE